MRLRNIKGAREEIAVSEYVTQNPKEWKGKWKEYFGTKAPLYVEIGMGKGKFITTLAKTYPEIHYIGVEKYASVLIRAIEKKKEQEGMENLTFLAVDAAELPEVFAAGEVDRIYLNFSDPWPKDRHAKRRLTSKEFLARYEQFLKPEGEIFFKTDNRQLFDFSLEEAKEAGWELKEVTYDLHHSPYAEGNVMTEYEEKFSALGNPIYRMAAKKPRRGQEMSV
ncbi:MAG: tRNA (guanosine(46)-N7)-methyltransferase TrmB [Lachnospiraceae bacterium]|nr:tRNA (guanosine(46)-N7)-methyltransferase TrmB [Lachnospiraceae bacterium]